MAKVLVIDDEPGVRGVMCRVLEAAGHDGVDFDNGGGAIEHVRQQPADLLITDLFMPDVEGIETIREIHRLRPDLPIIAVSGIDFEGGDYLNVARKFGAVATLKKPFSPADLLDLVSRVLSLA
jgi:two-component system, chemotaxis family, chemotaxis protein CheY